MNRYDIIYIDFSKTPRDCKNYGQYIARIQDGIVGDLMTAYPDCGINKTDSVWDAFQKIYEITENKLLFVMDEWDAVFHMPFIFQEGQ